MTTPQHKVTYHKAERAPLGPDTTMAPLLPLPALLLGPAAAELLTLLPDQDTSDIPACQDDTLLSCLLVTVDYAALEGKQLILPGGVMVSL